MKKITVLIPVISFLLIGCVSYSPHGFEGTIHIPTHGAKKEISVSTKKGASFEIKPKGGGKIKGELIAVTGNSLIVRVHESASDLLINISDIKVIRPAKKSGAITGMIFGAIAGGIIGYSSYHKPSSFTDELFVFDFGPGGHAASGVLLGMSFGLLVGGVMDLSRTIQVEGKSHAQINQILSELRKKSRYPDRR